MLDRILEGKDLVSSLPGPFIVAKSYNTTRGMDITGYEYSVVYSNKAIWDNGGAFNITKKYAQQLIEKFNMKLAMQSPDGRIYEMPGEPFREYYGKRNRGTARLYR